MVALTTLFRENNQTSIDASAGPGIWRRTTFGHEGAHILDCIVVLLDLPGGDACTILFSTFARIP